MEMRKDLFLFVFPAEALILLHEAIEEPGLVGALRPEQLHLGKEGLILLLDGINLKEKLKLDNFFSYFYLRVPPIST